MKLVGKMKENVDKAKNVGETKRKTVRDVDPSFYQNELPSFAL